MRFLHRHRRRRRPDSVRKKKTLPDGRLETPIQSAAIIWQSRVLYV